MSDTTSIGRIIIIGAILTAIVAGLGSAILIKQRQVRAARTPDAIATQQARDDAARQRQEFEARAASTRPAASADLVGQQFAALAAAVSRWGDAARLAHASPRMALGSHIATLQAIRRDTASIDGPRCLIDARSVLIRGMDAHINAMLDFLADLPGQDITERVKAAHATMLEAGHSASACQASLSRP